MYLARGIRVKIVVLIISICVNMHNLLAIETQYTSSFIKTHQEKEKLKLLKFIPLETTFYCKIRLKEIIDSKELRVFVSLYGTKGVREIFNKYKDIYEECEPSLNEGMAYFLAGKDEVSWSTIYTGPVNKEVFLSRLSRGKILVKTEHMGSTIYMRFKNDTTGLCFLSDRITLFGSIPYIKKIIDLYVEWDDDSILKNLKFQRVLADVDNSKILWALLVASKNGVINATSNLSTIFKALTVLDYLVLYLDIEENNLKFTLTLTAQKSKSQVLLSFLNFSIALLKNMLDKKKYGMLLNIISRLKIEALKKDKIRLILLCEFTAISDLIKYFSGDAE